MYLWHNIALIEDDAYFTPWVKQAKRLDHHQGFLKALHPYIKGTVLDIGANIGTHTIYYAKYASRVIAFEPNPVAFECLQHNLKNKAELHNVAVGSFLGKVSMVPQGDNYGAVYTEPSGTIPVITIDSLDLNACNYMKIDVEGDEIAVLHGAVKTILKFRPVMCIECNEQTLVRKRLTGKDLTEAIKALGYTHQVRQPEDISCDLICLPLP
jgi:FkbM family methyltransferase